MMILAAFCSCCYEFWLPFPPAAAEAWENTIAVKDGEAPKSHPENV